MVKHEGLLDLGASEHRMGQSMEPKQNNGQRGMYFSIICLICFTVSDSLEVKSSDSTILAPLDENVTIPCLISDTQDVGFNLPKVTVTWIHRSTNKSENNVYTYESQNGIALQEGFEMYENDLKTGNAALHIRRVQIRDEGEYICRVFYTPGKGESKASLKVYAQPTVIQYDPNLEILLGTEKSAVCEVIGFYPQSVNVKWVQYLKEGAGCVTLERSVCTGNPTLNKYGTYNLTSRLTLNPGLGDNGNTYGCVVTLNLIQIEQAKNFTLTVTELSQAGVISIVVLLVIMIIIGVAMAVWYFCFRKVPPTLSNITGNENLIHKSRVTLSCQIMNFRPIDIAISVRLRRKDGNEIEVYPWMAVSPGARIYPVPALDQTDGRGDYQPLNVLSNGESGPLVQRAMQLEVDSEFKSSRMSRESRCQCSIHITPDIDQDNEALLSLHVKHPALKTPPSVGCLLKVHGVPPKLSKIVGPRLIFHDNYLTLTCVINGFKPRPMSISWLRVGAGGGDRPAVEILTHDGNGNTKHDTKYDHNVTESMNDDDQTFSIVSTLIMKPSIKEDHGAKYICRVSHPASGRSLEESMDMTVSAKPVMDPIQNQQDDTDEFLHVDKAIELSCRIHSFHPQNLEVTWYKGNEEIPSRNRNTLTDANGLCSATSIISYTPRIQDIGQEFRCEVKHESLESPISQTWKFGNPIGRPKISDIQCEPKTPERDNPVTLSCTIRDFYPETCDVKWLLGSEEIQAGVDTGDAQQNTASGLFCRNTKLRFIPSVKDHCKDVIMRISHSSKTYEKKFCLLLNGLPHVKEMECDTLQPQYSKPLVLCCPVERCAPADVSAVWLENSKPMTSNKGIKTQENQKGNKKQFELHVTPTAEDFAKVYMCCVQHKDLPEPIKKTYTLKLPGIPPTLSEITASPPRPGGSRERTFRIDISGFIPRGLQVKWSREFQELKGNVVTSEQLVGEGGFFSCTSTLTYTSKDSDVDALIRCEVKHMPTGRTQQKQCKLNETGISDVDGHISKTPTLPKASQSRVQLSEITCVTARPRAGEDVTLTCLITGQKASDGTFSWCNGIFPIDDCVQTRDEEDNSGCRSSITFKPEPSDKECHIQFEAVFNHKEHKKNYVLKLV
uniref:Ig-like domain-containing protein n=1 Tax=Leptobrachium leishanense TaxID=445787 RepID=A0A8C5PEZ8_9ANUR